MPLLDHFHPPLAELRHWESFHTAWATEIMRTLNRSVLPRGCFAEAQVHVGGRVEIDVAAFEDERATSTATENGNSGGLAVATWAPPATSLIMPAVFPDEVEIQVFDSSGGATLVGAIELISPGNKDRPETRRAFAAKCASYLQHGIGLVIVDVVTERQANLHDELIQLMQQPAQFAFSRETDLYSAAYRPGRQVTGDQVELWLAPLAVGEPLPTMALALRGIATVPVDLEATYVAACADSRL